jgi:hypothetical protein
VHAVPSGLGITHPMPERQLPPPNGSHPHDMHAVTSSSPEHAT